MVRALLERGLGLLGQRRRVALERAVHLLHDLGGQARRERQAAQRGGGLVRSTEASRPSAATLQTALPSPTTVW